MRLRISRLPLLFPATLCLCCAAIFIAGCRSAAVAAEPVAIEDPVAAGPRSLSVLAIGNSYAGNATTFLKQLAASDGRELVVGLAITAGAPLDRHIRRVALHKNNPSHRLGHPYKVSYLPGYPTPPDGPTKVSLREALTYRTWDVVTIQQASYKSFKTETYEPFTTQLIELIRDTNPDARVLIHQTWSYRIDAPRFEQWGMTQQQMQQGLRDAYDVLSVQHLLPQIPVGDAFNLARATSLWSYRVDPAFDFEAPPPDTLPDQAGSLIMGYAWRKDRDTGEPALRLDSIHANTAGRYLASCVWYETLFGADARGLTYKPEELTEQQAESLQNIAHYAVRVETVWTQRLR